MSEATLRAVPAWRDRVADAGLFVWLGVVLGIVMPVVSALVYPTYMHRMEQQWLEWTRLLELPFVACELVVIHLAVRKGMNSADLWRRLPRDVHWACGLLLVGLFASTLLVSKDRAASLSLSLITLVHLQFGLAVFFLARAERGRDLARFVPLLGAGLLVLAGLTAWKFAFPPPPGEVLGGKIEWVAALPGFISVRHFGSWTGAVAAALMVTLLYGDGRPRGRWTAFLYFAAAGLTIWSGTRAAVIAVIVAAALAAVTLKRWPDRRSVGLVAGLTAAAAVAATLCLPAGEADFRLFAFGDLESGDSLTGGRLQLWTATYARWLDAPLFGWGSGSTFWEVDVGWTHTQPHNVVLQYLISWGLVGALGGLWLLGRAIFAVHRTGTTDARLRPLTAALHALLFMSLLEGMLHYPRFIMLIAVGFAVILAQIDGDRQRPQLH